MDIKVTLTDEDGQLVDSFSIYQDGSDSEGCAEIRDLLTTCFTVEIQADLGDDVFSCTGCGTLLDIEDSNSDANSDLWCDDCKFYGPDDEEETGECPHCVADAIVAADETRADDMVSEGGPVVSDNAIDRLIADDQVTDVWKDEDRSNCVPCVQEREYGVHVEHDCPYGDEVFEPYENDEDDGQPDEAKEWYDFDPDC